MIDQRTPTFDLLAQRDELRRQYTDLRKRAAMLHGRGRHDDDLGRLIHSVQTALQEIARELATRSAEDGVRHQAKAKAVWEIAWLAHRLVRCDHQVQSDLQAALARLDGADPDWRCNRELELAREVAEAARVAADPSVAVREWVELRRAAFSPADVAKACGIPGAVAQLAISRLVVAGLVTRVKKGLYVRATVMTKGFDEDDGGKAWTSRA